MKITFSLTHLLLQKKAAQPFQFPAFTFLLFLFFSFHHQNTIAQNTFPAGTFERGYGTPADDEAYAVCKTIDSGWCAAGYSEGFGNGKDFFIVNFDSSGHVMWSQNLNAQGDEIAYGIRKCTNGDLVVAGSTNSIGSLNKDVLVARYSSTGTFLWQQIIGSPNDNEYANEVLALSNGNIFVAGTQKLSGGNKNAAIWILDSVGNLVQTKIYALTGDEEFSDCELTHDGAVILCSSSINGANKILWEVKTDYNGDTLWTKEESYAYNYLTVTSCCELASNQLVFGGVERVSFGNWYPYFHVTDELGNMQYHQNGPLVSYNVTDIAPIVSTQLEGDFAYTGQYYYFNDHFGYVYVDSGGLNGFWRFIDPDTYTNWGYTVPEFNTPSNAIVSDVYDIYFHGLCFVGSTRLSGYGGKDFAIVRNGFQETKSDYDVPVITANDSTSITNVCNGTPVVLKISSNKKLTQRWMRISSPVDYNLSTDTFFNLTQGGVYCLAAYDVDSNMWISNTLVINIMDTVPPTITANGVLSFCGPSGQSVTLTASASIGATYQWYNSAGVINGATNNTYVANVTETFYCVMSNSCGSYTSGVTSVNAGLPPSGTFSFGGPVFIIHPWCPLYIDSPLSLPLITACSYDWYQKGVWVASGYQYAPVDTGGLWCIISNGCGTTNSDTIQVINLGPPSYFGSNAVSFGFCPGDTIYFQPPPFGMYGFEPPYQWYLNGNPIPGANDSIYAATQAGYYQLEYMMPSCNNFPILSHADTLYYTGLVLPASFTIQTNGNIMCNGNSVTLNAQIVSGFPNSYYSWGIVGQGYSFSGDTLVTQSWMPTGDYYCSLSNLCGNLINSNLIHITNVDADVSATSIASLCANPGGVLFKLDNPIIGATYQWNFNGTAIPGATDTIYFATQSGFYDCDVTFQTCVNTFGQQGYLAPSSFTISAAINAPACGQCNGFALLSSNGSLLYYPNYLWSDGATTYSRNNLCPGTYTVTATDLGGCTASTSFTLANQSTIVINQSNAVAPVNGLCNGSVNLNYSGGTPPYNVSFNPSVPVTGYCENTTYIVTVTDSNGCVTIDSILFYNDMDSVWPGDANNDHVADNMDMLALGIGIGSSRYARGSISNAWMPYSSVNWETTLAAGTDYKHIDCDGSGTIDLDDTMAIVQNFGQVHLFAPPQSQHVLNSAPLRFIVANDSVITGVPVSVGIEFGDVVIPADSIYGIAFQLSYNKNVIDPASLNLQFNNSWLGNSATNDLIFIQNNNLINAELKTGATATNHVNRSGNGIIANINFNTASSLTVWNDTLHLSFTNIRIIDKDEVEHFVNAEDNHIVVWDNTWLGIDNHNQDFNFNIYPNPAQNEINIISQQKAKVQLYDALNKLLLEKNIEAGKSSLNISTIADGIYMLKMSNGNAVKMLKLVVRK
ncbi:MAG: T9SS type A sorting domain-containing protein [Bacteroidia bacterium]